MMENIGVVVGRFQVDRLHEGHRFLLNEVSRRHSNVVIVLGIGPLPTTCRKPLSFETRAAIVQRAYPKATVIGLMDHPSDEVWSTNLDQLIDKLTSEPYPGSSIMSKYGQPKLYCSRDSFKDAYTGKYEVIELEDADLGVSGTLHRQLIAETPEGSEEFARGVIWANYNKFPTVYPVVDMAVFNHNPKTGHKELLVIEKSHADGYMLPGGFCDVGSPTDEADASREVLEETGIIVNPQNWEYLKSLRITSDWRYRDEVDEMRTRLYATLINGAPAPTAGDDAATANFVPFHGLTIRDFHHTHQVFFTTLLSYYNKIQIKEITKGKHNG